MTSWYPPQQTKAARKVTVELPERLLREAQESTGEGVTATIRRGLEPKPGFWIRAGALRAKVIALHRKAMLADTLIAQSCIDAGVELVTRDSDFRNFTKPGGLKILP